MCKSLPSALWGNGDPGYSSGSQHCEDTTVPDGGESLLWKLQRNPHLPSSPDLSLSSGKGYLSLSNDAYTLVKLTGQSEILLQPDAVLIMKMAREEKKKPKTEKESKKTKTKTSGVLSQEDEPLFQRLRQLRMEIAREEKVPPYIVFSDKTLVHMCIIKPHDKEEMLTVSGVGEHKYTKYGEKFLRKINNTQ